MRLEYRLDDEISQYPALWHYPHLEVSEVVCRMTCEYFVKDGGTYKVTQTVRDAGGGIVIYVEKEDFVDEESRKHFDYMGLEYRELGSSRVVESRELYIHDDALAILHCDVVIVKGKEFKLDSREIDEDRKCYVYYGNFSG